MNEKRTACLKLGIFTHEGKTRCAILPSSLTQMALMFGTGFGLRQCRIRSVNRVQRYDEIHPFVHPERRNEVCPSVRVESDRLVRFRRGSDGHLVSRDNHHAILSVAEGEAHPFALVPNFFARRVSTGRKCSPFIDKSRICKH